jgi:colanic acid/amylovoran biosynthesis protein
MNILVSNVHSAQNAGDLAILYESLVYLRAAFPKAKMTVAINDPVVDTERLDGEVVLSLTRWLVTLSDDGVWRWRKPLALPYAAWLLAAGVLYRLAGVRLAPREPARRTLMDAYYDADLVVVLGGGHLIARHWLNIAFLWLWVGLALAILMRKPLVFLPQSFGPLPGTPQRTLLRWLLDRAALVVCREYRSAQLLAEIGVRRRILTLPDVAFTAAEASPDAVDAALPGLLARTDQRPLIGLTLMDWGINNPQFRRQREYEAAIVALIRHLYRCYDARVVLFAQCYGPTIEQDDRLVTRRVAAALGPSERLKVADATLTPDVLKAAYRRLDVLVATRLHSAIFSLGAHVPTLVIGYVYKSVGVMEMLGLQRHVQEIDEIESEQLCAAFDRLWNDREVVRERLSERIPAFQSTLAHLPQLLQESGVRSQESEGLG